MTAVQFAILGPVEVTAGGGGWGSAGRGRGQCWPGREAGRDAEDQ
jgi:hypothetical protein